MVFSAFKKVKKDEMGLKMDQKGLKLVYLLPQEALFTAFIATIKKRSYAFRENNSE